MLYHRLCWLRGGYGVCVSMHNLPDPVFTPKDARSPQGNRSALLPSTNLGLVPLHLHDVGKLRGHVLRGAQADQAGGVRGTQAGARESTQSGGKLLMSETGRGDKAPALLLTLIHPSAGKWCSRKLHHPLCPLILGLLANWGANEIRPFTGKGGG